jgi:hypothetical protein
MSSLLSRLFLLSRASSATLGTCMKHWTLLALGGITFCGLTSLIYWMLPMQETYQRESVGPATMEEVTAIAAALGLHSVAFPLDTSEKDNALLSVRPLSLEQIERLGVNHRDFERWRGIVTIMGCPGEIFEANFNPAHPERCAMWGKWFVYGDPELIAKLLCRRQSSGR